MIRLTKRGKEGYAYYPACFKICKGDPDMSAAMFVQVESTNDWQVVYHKDTRVMYAVSDGQNNRGVFCLLVDADGQPLLWDGGN